ncbi:MAG TPA: glycosyltransferase family 2 protein [Streptosporangiaceae bacterium]|nr:glycosyltransferase family 2 protein [Streptosporangiaceae bacterium]
MTDVSAVVCTHRMDRFPWLLECLASLERQSLPPLEVMVVVDGKPEIRDRLIERGGPTLTLSTPAPSGLSVARNLGLAHASGSFVAFLDDDAVADGPWLESLREVLADETVAGVGGISLPRWEGRRPGWMPEELLWTLGCSYRGMPATRSEVRNVYGGCACFRKDVFDRFGGFNPNLGRMGAGLAGCEETELCVRVRNQAPELRFVYEPAARIFHRVPPARQKVSYVLSRCLGEGRSKATLRAVTVGGRPLASEADYLVNIVPSGIASGVSQSLRGDRHGLARASLLAAAVACTVASYGVTRVTGVLRRRRLAQLSEALRAGPLPAVGSGLPPFTPQPSGRAAALSKANRSRQ